MDRDIRQLATSRGITRLCHFTPSNNLVHILTNPTGVLATKHLNSEGQAVFNPTDTLRLDGYKEYVCCSIQYPNAWFFKKARANNIIFRDWVVLLINACHLWQETTRFCPRNAAAARGRYVRSGFDAFQSLFAERTEGFGGNVYTRGPSHPLFLPTDEQAEILIRDSVAREDIMGIVVESAGQARREIARFQLLGEEPPPVTVAPSFFEPRSLSRSLRSGKIPPEHEFTKGERDG